MTEMLKLTNELPCPAGRWSIDFHKLLIYFFSELSAIVIIVEYNGECSDSDEVVPVKRRIVKFFKNIPI